VLITGQEHEGTPIIFHLLIHKLCVCVCVCAACCDSMIKHTSAACCDSKIKYSSAACCQDRAACCQDRGSKLKNTVVLHVVTVR
jgi:hypothetical protein